LICIKNFNGNKDNKKISNLVQNSKVDSEYRNNDELTNENSYMEYELNNTFNDKDKKKLVNDKSIK
jgi:hypothetical protein